ncbi:MAG: hypothetical protein K0R66_818 [Gammaproteobacteria bacterium]|jgi:hypothetical protein|nr:hypothetical protein [Gammaproteobacteria bacterium]
MPAGPQRREPVEYFFIRIVEALLREAKPRLKLSSEIYEFRLAKAQKGIWDKYQDIVADTDFSACPTAWHRDILKLHIMAHISITAKPDEILCFYEDFQKYVSNFLQLMDSYIQKAARLLGKPEPSMKYFYSRLIFQEALLKSWPQRKQVQLVVKSKSLFINDDGEDGLGYWDKVEADKGKYKYTFEDSADLFNYLSKPVYRLANSALEAEYNQHFSTAERASSILSMERMKNQFRESVAFMHNARLKTHAEIEFQRANEF